MKTGTVEVVAQSIQALSVVLDKIVDAYARNKEIDLEMVRVRSQANVAKAVIEAQVKALECDAASERNAIRANLLLVKEKISIVKLVCKKSESDRRLLRSQIEEFSKVILDTSVLMSSEERKSLVETHRQLLGLLIEQSNASVSAIVETNRGIDKCLVEVKRPSRQIGIDRALIENGGQG